MADGGEALRVPGAVGASGKEAVAFHSVCDIELEREAKIESPPLSFRKRRAFRPYAWGLKIKLTSFPLTTMDLTKVMP